MTAGTRKLRRLRRTTIVLAALGACTAPPFLPPGDGSPGDVARPSTTLAVRHWTTLGLDTPPLLMPDPTNGRSAPVYYPGGAGKNVYATVAVTGTTAETCRDVEVRGPVNWVLFTEVGSGIDCYPPTHTRELGPVAYDALDPTTKAFYFTIGSRHPALTTQLDADGKTWEVRFDDDGDQDFDDVVLTVTFHTAP